jgi:aryl-alcohol dehydrogenase-like predicted oxidoreductase
MADIANRTLGRTGAEVSTLGYGSMELRGGDNGRTLTDDEVDKVLNGVLDSGITFVDTSIDYGIAEERIGKYISNRRNEYFLASKCGCLNGDRLLNRPEGRFPHDYTRANIVEGVEQSLRRMNTDHLDLVQLHASPSKEVLEEHDVIATLKDLQVQGKVQFIGMSGTIPNLADHIAMDVFDVFQIPYSCVERKHEELISQAAAAGAGIIIRGGAAKGAPSDSDRARERNGELLSVWDKAHMDDLLENESAMEFIIRFTGTHPSMTTNIVGTINPDHLAANVAAVSKGPLSADTYEEAKRRLADAGSAPGAVA